MGCVDLPASKMRETDSMDAGHSLVLLHCADALGTVGLLFCLAAGSAYQQPPLRSARKEQGESKEPLMAKKENIV